MSFDGATSGGSLAEAEWRVWGFTSVIYQRGDYVAFAMGLLSLAPQVLIVAFLAVNFTAFHRRFIGMHACMLISEAINKVMKEWFKEKRPEHPCPFAVRQDYGFPSSHAQLMFLFATYSAFILLRAPPEVAVDTVEASSPKKKATVDVAMASAAAVSQQRFRLQRIWVIVGLYVIAILVSVSRVWNHYHTAKQVVVGGAMGTLLGVLFCTIRPFERMIERAVLWLERTQFLQSWYAMVGIAPVAGRVPVSGLYSKNN